MNGDGTVEPLVKLIRNVRIFAPSALGTGDILICGERVAAVGDGIGPPTGIAVDVVDGEGMTAVPGFVDMHVHVTGGGGEGGPETRVPERRLSGITAAGVTTVVGVLGTDDVTRSPEALLAKTLGLRRQGLSAFMMCGSYQFPPATVTGSVRRDIALIPPVIGVGEVALSDHRSSQPSFREFARLVAEARVGGLLGGKPGLVQVHMGGGSAGMEMLFRIAGETEIPLRHLMPTHVTRSRDLFAQAARLAEMGGSIDMTATGARRSSGVDSSEAVRIFRDGDIPIGRVTISSDAGGSVPVFDGEGNLKGLGVASMDTLQEEFRRLVLEDGLEPEVVLTLFTSNPAHRIGMEGLKGCIRPGSHADIVIYDDAWRIGRVYAGGRLMVLDGRPVEWGTFEPHEWTG